MIHRDRRFDPLAILQTSLTQWICPKLKPAQPLPTLCIVGPLRHALAYPMSAVTSITACDCVEIASAINKATTPSI
jgi:hypothetical protein